MGVINEVLNGYSKRIRMENSLQLQKAKIVRPRQIKLEASEAIKRIDDELQDPVLRTIYDSIEIKAPEDI